MTSQSVTIVINKVINKTGFKFSKESCKEHCMEANITVTSGPGEELDIYSVTYPLYALYLKVFLVLCC